jgi:hypothetical protein
MDVAGGLLSCEGEGTNSVSVSCAMLPAAWLEREQNEPGDRTVKKSGALFRDVEPIHERFESGIILALHGQDQSDIVASLQQEEHFAQVIISASRNFTKCESSA